MLGEHDSIVVPPGSAYAKEMCKWESQHTKYGPPGRPFVQQDYPKMLYICERVSGKGIQIKERFTVGNETEEQNMRSRGYYSLGEAEARLNAEHLEHGTLAAEREWQIQHGRLGEKAIAEVRAAEAEHGARHLPDVPETPIQRRVKREGA